MAAQGAGCSRREALALLAITGAVATGAAPALSYRAASGRALGAKTAVTSYFNDGLLADPSATLPPYRRPGGYRGTGRLARMSEAERIAAGLTV